ncbi:hypothetical protein KZZ10_10255 [Alcaligenaceae bacterium LF4-65]|uniref:AlgX/AlgJ SGNH hydrolase-like domain-containing protein n=1 Tax=Zwartia hollandica TaxID=324606 RepID=A0A953NB27_9BURK|nr:hypothetical protein [Zwartia hollandica]MBZ1351027.1 hypothetical protein [Zwartia hollandica]
MKNSISIRAITGRNDFLFLDGDNNNVIKQTEGKLLFDRRQLIMWISLIKSRILLFREMGIDYRFIVPPNKESIYYDLLPDNIKFSSLRPITQILSEVKHYSKYIYYNSNRDDFPQVDPSHGFYPKGETHWNDGFAYEYIKRALLGTVFNPLAQTQLMQYSKQELRFDLGSKISQSYTEPILGIRPKEPKSRLVKKNELQNMGSIEIWENSNRSLPTAVVFRDSFFTNLTSLFAESFSRVVYLWHPWVDYEVIEDERPDLVLNCTVERFMMRLPCDFTSQSYRDIEKSKT